MKLKHRTLSYVIAALAILFFSLSPFLFEGVRELATPSLLRELLLDAGVWGYLLIILLILASNPLPIPMTAIVLASGYAYGLLLGSLVSLAGIVLGSSLSFLLIRKFGRPFLAKLVDEHHINHFNCIFRKRGPVAALISYAVPLFPSDAVSLLLGLTKIRFTTFLGLVTLGHIPRVLIINSLGGNLYSGLKASTVYLLLGCLLFVLIAFFRERLKKLFFKELHTLEKEAEFVGKEVKIVGKEVEKEVGKEARTVEKEVRTEAKKTGKKMRKEVKALERKSGLRKRK